MPTPSTVPNRRILVLLVAAIGLVSLLSWTFSARSNPDATFSSVPIHQVSVNDDVLKGDAIMGKIGNETIKAELGRAAWKLLHTTMAKFPDKPSKDEQTALFSYIHLFARLYPCGECAGHFRQILNHYPPQVSSRSSAAAWACHVHNEVNKSLQKDLFDCSNIGDFYDCGCAEEDEKRNKKAANTDRIDIQVEDLG
ncbi:ERV/ALR sulfhydryl oxidase domain-containing protein [Usnea florida]